MTVATETLDYVRTGPDTIAGRFLRTFWHPVYRAEDLTPGRAIPIQIMSERFTLYRGQTSASLPHPGSELAQPPPLREEEVTIPSASRGRVPADAPVASCSGRGRREAPGEGAPHLVAFRCAHRGTQLSVGWVEGDWIRCRYHGWMYDADGQCVEQPGEDPEVAERVRIRSYPVQEYLGLIFAYLGEGAPPALPRYPEFEEPGVLDVYPPEYWPCNYFNRLDNAPDLGHVHFAHRDSREAATTVTGIGTVHAEETVYGVRTSMPLPGQRSTTVHYHMPNINQFVSRTDLRLRDRTNTPTQGRLARLLIRLPIDDEHCVSFPIDHVDLTGEAGERYLARRRALEESQLAAPLSPEAMGDRVLASRMAWSEVRARDAANLKTLTSVEDYVVQCGQGAIADHANERLGRMDAGLILIRAIWQRELRSFADGRPLKQWSRTEPLDP